MESGINSQPGGPVRQPYLLYQLARLHRLAESIPQNRFLGSLNVYKYGLRLHLASRIDSLESILGLLKHLQIRAQATLASRIGSLESIPGLLKGLQIRAQTKLASGIGSLQPIPGLLKRLRIRVQATLANGIGSLESIPRLHNMKNKDEDNLFWIETNIFVSQLSKGGRITLPWRLFFATQQRIAIN
jgi:hypothetical protein